MTFDLVGHLQSLTLYQNWIPMPHSVQKVSLHVILDLIVKKLHTMYVPAAILAAILDFGRNQ